MEEDEAPTAPVSPPQADEDTSATDSAADVVGGVADVADTEADVDPLDLPVYAWSRTRVLRGWEEAANAAPWADVPIDAEAHEAFLASLGRWTFDPYNLPGVAEGAAVLAHVGWTLLEECHGLVTSLGLSPPAVRHFLRLVGHGYHPDNPYHNAHHAADVAVGLNFFLTRPPLSLSRTLSQDDLFAALLAALVHDLDHVGLNNAFLVNTNDDLAFIHNDQSVLEHHHLTSAFAVMRAVGLLDPLEYERQRRIRETVIALVLATDFARHVELVAKGRQVAEETDGFDLEDKGDRHLLLSLALKAADIGHTAKTREVHLAWTRRVSQEFWHQGDLEREEGLAVSPFMDRRTPQLQRSQSGFISFLVLPLFTLLVDLFGEEAALTLNQLRDNLQFWSDMSDEDATTLAAQWM